MTTFHLGLTDKIWLALLTLPLLLVLILTARVLLARKPVVLPSRWWFVPWPLMLFLGILSGVGLGDSFPDVIGVLVVVVLGIMVLRIWQVHDGYTVVGVDLESFVFDLPESFGQSGWESEFNSEGVRIKDLEADVVITATGSWPGVCEFQMRPRHGRIPLGKIVRTGRNESGRLTPRQYGMMALYTLGNLALLATIWWSDLKWFLWNIAS